MKGKLNNFKFPKLNFGFIPKLNLIYSELNVTFSNNGVCYWEHVSKYTHDHPSVLAIMTKNTVHVYSPLAAHTCGIISDIQCMACVDDFYLVEI